MILTLFFACILPGKDLVGDSDRPFAPPLNEFDVSTEEAASEGLYASVDGDDVYVEHYDVHLPCDFDESEVTIHVDEDEFYVEVIYSEREPDGCYNNLEYTLDFEGASSGTYTLEAHGDETTFEY